MTGISKAYNDAIEKIDSRIFEACKKAGHEEVYIRFSAYDPDEWDIPIDNLDIIPIKGKIKFKDGVFDVSRFREIYEPFESEIYDSPTWLEICVIANEMIMKTKDVHHIYLEMLGDVHKEDEVTIATLIMGS